MSGSTAARSLMIYNERTRLIANAYDRASTAMGAGSLLPLINLSKPSDGMLSAPAVIQFVLAASFFIFCGRVTLAGQTGFRRASMMDPFLLLAYFALPATISLLAFVGLKLHERRARPMAQTDEPEVGEVWAARDGVRVSIVLDGLSETVSERDLQRAIEAANRALTTKVE